jgi:hypothetical protein
MFNGFAEQTITGKDLAEYTRAVCTISYWPWVSPEEYAQYHKVSISHVYQAIAQRKFWHPLAMHPDSRAHKHKKLLNKYWSIKNGEFLPVPLPTLT